MFKRQQNSIDTNRSSQHQPQNERHSFSETERKCNVHCTTHMHSTSSDLVCRVIISFHVRSCARLHRDCPNEIRDQDTDDSREHLMPSEEDNTILNHVLGSLFLLHFGVVRYCPVLIIIVIIIVRSHYLHCGLRWQLLYFVHFMYSWYFLRQTIKEH